MLKTLRLVVWVRGVKAGLERRQTTIAPTVVYVHEAGTPAMIHASYSSTNKHIRRTMLEIRERVRMDKVAQIIKVPEHQNIATALSRNHDDQQGPKLLQNITPSNEAP